MDNTMYVFDGSTRAKSGLALAVITKYATEKKATLEQLEEIFGKAAVSNETRAKALADTSGRRRHFLDSPIKCGAKTVYVSNQWRIDTIEKLIETAKKLGFKISVAKEKQELIAKKAEVKKVVKKPVKKAAVKKVVKK